MSSTLLSLYDARDEMARPELAKAGVACKAGCCWCCSQPVAITLADADIVGSVIDTSEYRKAWIDHCEGLLNAGWEQYRWPCSMLTADGACGVYAHRPWPCRVHNSRDASLCERRETVEVNLAPWDRMFARLAQIATTQESGRPLDQQSISAANRRWFLAAAMLHLDDHWGGAIPPEFEYTPGPMLYRGRESA